MAKRPDTSVPGLVIVDKPRGVTSHDVVARMRRLAHTRKVGHGGTLDPMATGLLVVGIGAATRLLTYVSGDSKSYDASIRFGFSTTTDDAEGEAVDIRGCDTLGCAAIDAAITELRGEIMQVPSTVSAIKVHGERAYALARRGEDVALTARPVTIHRFERTSRPRVGVAQVESVDGGGARASRSIRVVDVDVSVDCSSGTYIRALARDLGRALGVGAHLTALRRTRVGAFTLDDARSLSDLEEAVPAVEGGGGRAAPGLISLDDAVRALFPSIPLTPEETARFAHGVPPARRRDEVSSGGPRGPIAALSPQGRALGLVRFKENRLITVCVFTGANT